MRLASVFFFASIFVSAPSSARPLFPEPRNPKYNGACELSVQEANAEIRMWLKAAREDNPAVLWQDFDLNERLREDSFRGGILKGMHVLLKIKDPTTKQYSVLHGYIYGIERVAGKSRRPTGKDLRRRGVSSKSRIVPMKTSILFTPQRPSFTMDTSSGMARFVDPKWPEKMDYAPLAVPVEHIVAAKFLPR